jgi:hypothetical protein
MPNVTNAGAATRCELRNSVHQIPPATPTAPNVGLAECIAVWMAGKRYMMWLWRTSQMSLPGSTRPTWALQQVVGYLRSHRHAEICQLHDRRSTHRVEVILFRLDAQSFAIATVSPSSVISASCGAFLCLSAIFDVRSGAMDRVCRRARENAAAGRQGFSKSPCVNDTWAFRDASLSNQPPQAVSH